MCTKNDVKMFLTMLCVLGLMQLPLYAKSIYILEDGASNQMSQQQKQVSIAFKWSEEELNQLDEALKVEILDETVIQLMGEVAEEVTEENIGDEETNKKKLVEQLSSILSEHKGKLYLCLYGTTKEGQEQVQVIYEALSKESCIAENTALDLTFVYTLLNQNDKLFKDMPYVKGLNVTLESIEDRQLLKVIKSQYGESYELIATDYLAEGYGQNLSEGLDAISKFYYDAPFDCEEVDRVFRMQDLTHLPAKYGSFYKGLEQTNIRDYKPIQKGQVIKNSNLALMVRLKEQIEYMEYKVNDAPAGQSFRYPYQVTIDPELLHSGINEIKVIAKMKDQEAYKVEQFYIDNDAEMTYGERAARVMPSYDKGQKPLYKKPTASKPYIPVLMYHKFKDKVEPTEEAQSMCVSVSLFEAQLKALLEAGYTPINFKQLHDYLEGKAGLPSKPIIITADDGYLCNYTKAYPILKKYGAQATFFVTSLYVGVTNEHEHFTWEQAKEMEASGLIDIQSHTHGHTLMNELNKEDVLYEVQKSFADIEKNLGKRDVKVLAYPQFLHTSKVKEWVEDMGIDIQVTNLVSRPTKTTGVDVKRIHVSNDLSPKELLRELSKWTD